MCLRGPFSHKEILKITYYTALGLYTNYMYTNIIQTGFILIILIVLLILKEIKTFAWALDAMSKSALLLSPVIV